MPSIFCESLNNFYWFKQINDTKTLCPIEKYRVLQNLNYTYFMKTGKILGGRKGVG